MEDLDLPLEQLEILIDYLCGLIPQEVDTVVELSKDPFKGIDLGTLH